MEELNCNYSLTKDRVERAIAEIAPNPSRWGQGIPSPESAQTILAALDAVRWRDAETEPPEANATVLVRWKAENGVQGYNFSYFEDGNWYGNSGYKIIEWLPLPTCGDAQ